MIEYATPVLACAFLLWMNSYTEYICLCMYYTNGLSMTANGTFILFGC